MERILVVDDEDTIRALAQYTEEIRDRFINLAENGKDAAFTN